MEVAKIILKLIKIKHKEYKTHIEWIPSKQMKFFNKHKIIRTDSKWVWSQNVAYIKGIDDPMPQKTLTVQKEGKWTLWTEETGCTLSNMLRRKTNYFYFLV